MLGCIHRRCGMRLTGLGFALATLLSTAAPAYAEYEPPMPGMEQIERQSDGSLALSLLVASEMLTGKLGGVHALWKKTGSSPLGIKFSTPIAPGSDGSKTTHVFTSFADIDRFVGKIRRLRAAYQAEATRRGSNGLLGVYVAYASSGCGVSWPGERRFDVTGDGPTYRLEHSAVALPAAAVGDTIIVFFAGGKYPPLVGKIHAGVMMLRANKGGCFLTLGPAS